MTEPPRRSQDLKENESRRSKDKFYEILEGHFFGILIGVACIGIGLAFTAPLWFHLFNALYNSIFLFKLFNIDISAGDSVSALRQAILTATGGALAIFTLLETHQKNIREKEKNEQDHIRQVHAERRSRYAKAVEQLADEKAPIRLGGVYTLVKLVNDWLNDEKTLPYKDERRQEGQIIIDSLCAYIRSSFLLAERHEEFSSNYEDYKKKFQNNNQPIQSREEFVRDKSLFQEEQEVRKTILAEIKKRLNGGRAKNKYGIDEIQPGTWSYFKYDFSNTVFFYDVEFDEVNFSGKNIFFFKAKFIQEANFSNTNFSEEARFSGTKFYRSARFHDVSFKTIEFNLAEFEEKASFSHAFFKDKAIFNHAKFKNYCYPNFKGSIFEKEANFYSTHFNQGADFSNSTFKSVVDLDFAEFIHKKGIFITATFYEVLRLDSQNNINIIFHDKSGSARFAKGSNFPSSYTFINSYKHRSPDGTITTIPEGCIVFDPETGEEVPHTPVPNGSA